MDTYQATPQMASQTYDYEDYDRIWQRVLPELNTFPESRNEDGDLPGTPIPGDDDLMELPGGAGRGYPPGLRPGGGSSALLQGEGAGHGGVHAPVPGGL